MPDPVALGRAAATPRALRDDQQLRQLTATLTAAELDQFEEAFKAQTIQSVKAEVAKVSRRITTAIRNKREANQFRDQLIEAAETALGGPSDD